MPLIAPGEPGHLEPPPPPSRHPGGSLDLNPHAHLLALDGVYNNDGHRAGFTETRAPTQSEIAEVTRRVRARVLRELERRGMLRDPNDARSEAEDEPILPLALDGVYVRDVEGALVFHALPPPSGDDVAEVAAWTHAALLVVPWTSSSRRAGAR